MLNHDICKRRLLAALSLSLALPACSARDGAPSADEGLADTQLTRAPESQMWGYPNHHQPAPAAGQTIDACFLDPPGSALDSQKQHFQEVVYNTWEFAANVHVNWIAPCPATGNLVRIAVHGRAGGAGVGWAIGVGTSNKKGPTADNFATQGTCQATPSTCPSIKVWAANTPGPSDFSIVGYTAAHEFGHALGFQHEQDSPLNRDSNGDPIFCPEGLGNEAIDLTEYDPNSVMNYCANIPTSRISYLDIAGAQQVYGPSGRYQAAIFLASR